MPDPIRFDYPLHNVKLINYTFPKNQMTPSRTRIYDRPECPRPAAVGCFRVGLDFEDLPNPLRIEGRTKIGNGCH